MPISSIGSGGGRDYANFGTWEAATTLDALSEESEIGQAYDDSDFDNSLGILINGSGAFATSVLYRALHAAPGHEYDPISDTGVYVFGAPTAANRALFTVFSEGFVRIGGSCDGTLAADGGAMRLNHQGANSGTACLCEANTGQSGARFERCFLTSVGAGTTNCHGVLCLGGGGAGVDWLVRSCIAVGGAGTANTFSSGFFLQHPAGGPGECHNCVAINIDRGGGLGDGFTCNNDAQVQLRNCIAMNSAAADFANVTGVDGDYLIASDTTAFGANSFDSEVDTDIFVDPAGSDFHILETGNAYNNGEPQASAFEDYEGTVHGTNTGSWAIGAFDGPAAGGFGGMLPAYLWWIVKPRRRKIF